MVQGGPRWSKVVQGGPRWSKVVQGGPRFNHCNFTASNPTCILHQCPTQVSYKSSLKKVHFGTETQLRQPIASRSPPACRLDNLDFLHVFTHLDSPGTFDQNSQSWRQALERRSGIVHDFLWSSCAAPDERICHVPCVNLIVSSRIRLYLPLVSTCTIGIYRLQVVTVALSRLFGKRGRFFTRSPG